MDEKIRKMLPYFRSLGFNEDGFPYIIFLFSNKWHTNLLKQEKGVTLENLRTFEKAFEYLVTSKSLTSSLDTLQNLVYQQIIFNEDNDKKQELQEKFMKELAEKFSQANLKDLEAFNLDNLFTKETKAKS